MYLRFKVAAVVRTTRLQVGAKTITPRPQRGSVLHRLFLLQQTLPWMTNPYRIPWIRGKSLFPRFPNRIRYHCGLLEEVFRLEGRRRHTRYHQVRGLHPRRKMPQSHPMSNGRER